MSKTTEPQQSGAGRQKINVLAYGFDRFGTRLNQVTIELEDMTIFFVSARESVSWAGFDLVVFRAGTFLRQDELGRPVTDRHAVLRRKKEFEQLFRAGGAVCCLVHALPREIEGRRDSEDAKEALLSAAILSLCGVQYTLHKRDITIQESHVQEFASYLSRFGQTFNTYEIPPKAPGAVLSTTADGGAVTGFELYGRVFYLPCMFPSNTWDDVTEVVKTCAAAVVRYRTRMATELPGWLDELPYPEEAELAAQLEELEEQRSAIQAQLEGFRDRKKLLVTQSDPLVDAVIEVLDWIGIATRRDEKYHEDLWLLDPDGLDLAVGEVKGLGKNVRRPAVNQVDNHRTELGLEEDTPGILIVNTFLDASSLDAKDQQVEPGVARHAARVNVTVIRTLDLFRFVCMVFTGEVEATELLDVIADQGGGWLRIDGRGVKLLKNDKDYHSDA